MSVGTTKLGYEAIHKMVANLQSTMEEIDSKAEVKAVKQAGQDGYVFTVTVNGKTENFSITRFPDLEAPGQSPGLSYVATEKMIEKLENLKSILGISDTAIDKLVERFTATVRELKESRAEIGKSLFDVFMLMTLLIEIGQKERNAQRAMRKAEIEAIAATIRQQANIQRDAARMQLTGAAIALGLSIANAAFTIGMTAKISGQQIMANKMQTLAEQKFDVAQSRMRTANPHAPPKSKEADEYANAQRDLKVAGEERNMRYADVVNANMHMMWAKAAGDLFGAATQFASSLTSALAEMRRADATEMQAEQKRLEEFLDLTKIMFNQSQSVIDSGIQAMQSVLQTENQSMLAVMRA